MTRYIALGNGNILVCIDKNYRIRDFFFPYVGQENHVSGKEHKIGVFVDGKFSWISKDNWNLSIKYEEDTLVTNTIAENNYLEIKLTINETVHPDKNILIRKVKVENLSEKKRKIKVFFSQSFHISEANIGDTVYYNPELKSIINYKGKRYFLIGGMINDNEFTEYATGSADGIQNKQGTWVDAEDGELSKNPIEHGSVDSTIELSSEINDKSSQDIYYWIAVGKDIKEVKELREMILNRKPENLLHETEEKGKTWVSKEHVNLNCLQDKKITKLFRQSLLILRTQVDNRGAIIAANDTHTFRNKKDTYSYMWPRDGALVARSLDRTGHHKITNRFFEFCARVVDEKGCLMHKYRPDGSMGSSWHSWLKGNELQLPIQEDGTALVMDALWKDFELNHDEELIKKMYNSFIKKAGDFMVDFRNEVTKLPRESYDLWEEKLGIHTFTCATVYAGLIAAKNFAERFGTTEDKGKYEKTAEEVKQSIITHLYDEKQGIFIKGIKYDENKNAHLDKTVDSSTFYGLFEYKILEMNDPRLQKTYEVTIQKLMNKNGKGGMCRYEDDQYYRYPNSSENPWFVCTMWLAEYYIKKATNTEELNKAKDLLKWVVDNAIPTGVLSEQIKSSTGEPLSVAPLTWSHAGFIIAVMKYVEKYEELTK